ncbi:TolC family protein [candidate division KSB1 bacterium]|nr:TolC family protein [candidate division KSB1 bacterium]
MKNRLPILLIVGVMCWPLIMPTMALFADDATAPQLLTMDESINRALSKNNMLRASQFGLKKAAWNQKYAWTQLFPTLSLNSRWMRIDDSTLALRDFRRYLPEPLRSQIPETVFQNSYYTELAVSAPLFNGALLNGLSVARANKRMAEKLNSSTREQVIFQVISTYLGVLRSQDLLALQREYQDLSRMNFEKAERLHNAGRNSRAEMLRWKVDYQQQKSVVVSSESGVRSTRTALGRLISMDMNDNIIMESHIPDVLEKEAQKLSATDDQDILEMIKLSDDALIKANAALAAQKSSADIGKALYRNSYANFMPNVNLTYTHAWFENNTIALDNYSPKTLMVNVSMPLFTSFQNVAATRAAYFDFRQGEEQYYDALRNTKFVLTETVNKIINLKVQRELLKTTVELSDHNYRIVEQQRDKGLVSNIDFIDAKLNLQNAKLDEITTEYDFMTAMVELYYLLGKLETLVVE